MDHGVYLNIALDIMHHLYIVTLGRGTAIFRKGGFITIIIIRLTHT